MQRWRGDHGSECAEQMQGQMHVHVPQLDLPVPLLAHIFRRLLAVFLPLAGLLLASSGAGTLRVLPFP
ncbi:hypothetical protein FE633_32670 [Streptomyces montanus]|uniref:Uncharacterized protein n=1 Tax=Streptomyces montanus TaxID=2580423 RepID=A0A5R9FHW7_9ACTN|nr:hypothetical protein FE633_32670 [Streptomyces montanus]